MILTNYPPFLGILALLAAFFCKNTCTLLIFCVSLQREKKSIGFEPTKIFFLICFSRLVFK